MRLKQEEAGELTRSSGPLWPANLEKRVVVGWEQIKQVRLRVTLFTEKMPYSQPGVAGLYGRANLEQGMAKCDRKGQGAMDGNESQEAGLIGANLDQRVEILRKRVR